MDSKEFCPDTKIDVKKNFESASIKFSILVDVFDSLHFFSRILFFLRGIGVVHHLFENGWYCQSLATISLAFIMFR
jgi:hypothetical protein